MHFKNLNTELVTTDLVLRPVTLEDADDLFQILSDSESVQYWMHDVMDDVTQALKVLKEDVDSDA